MESIRQRRRNRYRIKAARKRVKRPIIFTFNIDVTKVNAFFTQTKDAMMRLSCIQETVREAFQKFALISPDVIRGLISARLANAVDQEVELDYLGDPSCKFNARSQHLQCAVKPDGDCVTCRHYE